MDESKERIFIKKIEVKNIGRFYGSHSIDFSSSPDKNITIIIGLSGRGKSTLHDSIYWGLYGDHKNSKEDEETDYGLMNIDVLNHLPKGGSETAAVVLHLYNEQKMKYVLTRELVVTYEHDSTQRQYNSLNNSMVSTGMSFEQKIKLVYLDENGNQEMTKETDIIKNEINKYFPQHLSDFFLFDGEDLSQFQANRSSEFIKDGITKISGLEILSAMSESASKTASGIDKYIGGKSANAAPFVANVNKLTHKKNELERSINDCQNKLNDTEKRYHEISKKMAQNKDSADLKKRWDDAKDEKKRTVNNKRKNDDAIKDMFFEKIPQLLLQDTLQESEKIFSRLEDEDKIPPSISRGALDKILNSNPLRCVCGRKFEKNDDPDGPWTTLNRTKDTIIEDGLSQGISSGRELIGRMIDDASIKRVRKIYDDLMINRRELNKDIQRYDANIANLDAEIRDIGIDNEQDLGVQLSKQWDEIQRHLGEISMQNQDLDELKSNLANAEKKRDEAIEKEGKYENETKKKSLAKAVSKFANKLEKRIEEILRNKTQVETYKYFKGSAPESHTFDRVEIDKDYNIIVKDHSGLNSALSKGQAHVLGLSYVAGIRQITHTDTFLIIDSPLHNISGKARNEISEAFSRYLPGVQIILLVTDTEYLYGDDEGAAPVKNVLREGRRVWKEYSIESIKVPPEIESRVIKEV